MAPPGIQPHSSAGQVNAPAGVEGMFQQILQAVQKSHIEIADLRQECAELRLANGSLERQIREGLQVIATTRFMDAIVTLISPL
ncbi:hypothetical protein C0991_000788 [Blastosporella zonata]|nr:hypothetical protein C0991_000788 [Blastosporella zonata]